MLKTLESNQVALYLQKCLGIKAEPAELIDRTAKKTTDTRGRFRNENRHGLPFQQIL
jgi:hypothetical protein